MDVAVTGKLREDPYAADAATMISRCVHCGFCNAACPTYALEHNELDGPRGRIYLVKQLLEQRSSAATAQQHLDRCLTCRACESACPSGVEYARIAHAGRLLATQAAPRPLWEKLRRLLLTRVLRSRFCCRWLRRLANVLYPILPVAARRVLPRTAHRIIPAAPVPQSKAQVSVLAGCVQEGLMPSTNRALLTLLAQAGLRAQLVTAAPCCGALSWHTDQQQQGLADVRATLRASMNALRNGSQAILLASSGCASFVAEYPQLAGLTAAERAQAAQLASKLMDPADFLLQHLAALKPQLKLCGQGKQLTLHCPCTQKHGLHVPDVVARLLTAAGYAVRSVPDAPACCGSAGTYAVLQRAYAGRLRAAMLNSLEQAGAPQIASANIGCILHLRQASQMPVEHWLDILAGDIAS